MPPGADGSPGRQVDLHDVLHRLSSGAKVVYLAEQTGSFVPSDELRAALALQEFITWVLCPPVDVSSISGVYLGEEGRTVDGTIQLINPQLFGELSTEIRPSDLAAAH